jgi:chemotaxis-related protein WspD
VSATLIMGCWKAIGTHGDGTCARLVQHVHCRNCPVQAAAAAQLLDAAAPPGYTQEWTELVAAGKPGVRIETIAVVIFRLGAEWLALPSAIFKEVAADRLIHALPHRRNGALLGVANIRGELLVCASLTHLLGVDVGADVGVAAGSTRRMLVIQQNSDRTVCPVDEVHGIERFAAHALGQVPATLGSAALTFTRAVLSWRQRSVGVLDAELIFDALNRSFQSATLT